MNIAMHGKLISVIWVPNADHSTTIESKGGRQLQLSATHHGDRDEFWVVELEGEKEIARYNPRYLDSIVWAEDPASNAPTERAKPDDEQPAHSRNQQFRAELERLINRYSRESGCDTPDFLLSGFLDRCLQTFEETVVAREIYYGRECGSGKAMPIAGVDLVHKDGLIAGVRVTSPIVDPTEFAPKDESPTPSAKLATAAASRLEEIAELLENPSAYQLYIDMEFEALLRERAAPCRETSRALRAACLAITNSGAATPAAPLSAAQPQESTTMTTIIKPTVGRVVWYTPPSNSASAGFNHYGSQPMAAQIAYVHSDSMVTLQVIDHAGFSHARQSVPLVQAHEPKPEHGHYCEWMPYQVGQAKAQAEAK